MRSATTNGKSSLVIHFAYDATPGIKRALHPSGPDGRVFASKMDTSFGSAERFDKADLSRRVKCKRAALPGVEAPTVGDATLEEFREFRKDLPRLIECRTDAFVFGQVLQH